MKSRSIIFLFLSVLAVITVGCRNPLGLGPAADIASPGGDIDIYQNGEYVSGTINLSGTSTDDVKIDSVRMILGTEAIDAELEPGEITFWSIPINTAAYPDGEYTIIIIITDSSGRETEKRLLLFFDNTPPTVLVTSTEGITSGASTNFPVIRGEAYDYWFSRIDRIEAEVVSGNAEILSLQGTNGWNLGLKTTGTGTYSVKISAYDSAGNSNSWLYHSSDLPVNTKIEDVAAAEKTGKLGSLILSTVRMPAQDVEVDLSLDEPRIVVSNPEEGKTAAQNILGGTSVAVGYIEDDDEVDTSSVSLSTDGGTSWTVLSGAQLSGSGGFVRWSYDLSGLANGVYSLQVKAADTGKPVGDVSLTGYSAVVPFTIDKTAPSVAIDSPLQGAYLSSGNFTVTGTAEDIGGSIQTVRASINGGEYTNVPVTPGESISWSHTVTGAPAGAVDISIEAFDNSGKNSRFNTRIYIDTDAPSVSFLSPSLNQYINGTATLQGVSSDNWSLKQVKLQIGGLSWDPAAAEVLPPAEFYSWRRSIISSNFENTGMAVEVNGSGTPQAGTGIWELKIWAEAVDQADNSTLLQHRLYIDNSLDRPGVNIASPSDGSVLAGSVMLSGSAWDDKNEPGEDLDHIEIRVWKGTASGSDTVFNDLFDLGSLLGLTDVYGDGSWFEVSGTAAWSTELNAGGEFYPDGSSHNGTVKIDVRAVDQKDGTADLAGNIQSVVVTFDDTVPYFSNLSHNSGDYEHGSFTLTGDVNDDDSVKRLRISYNGGVDWQTIGTDLGASSSFSQLIDTSSIIGSSGILYLRLEALDTANYKTLAGINLNVDNLNPTGTYEASVINLSGTAAVQGTATDTGTVSGINRIEVAFTLDGTPVNALNSKGVRTPIVINSRTEYGNDSSANGDDDGFNESMNISGSSWLWWAEFDSDSLDDGVLEVIYTVYDNAGNAYTETVTGGNIKNHAPDITSVDAGWDFDHDGNIEAGESRSYSSSTVENNVIYGDLSYRFNTDYDGQNGALDYSIRIKPVSTGIWTDFPAAAASGLIDTQDSSVFTDGDGDYDIEFSVVDTKGYASLLTLSVTVSNQDGEVPVMVYNSLTDSDAAAVKTSETGHIEIGAETWLSGVIPFSGTAEDNQRIESITMRVNGGPPVAVVEWDTVDKRLEYSATGQPLESGSGFIEDGGRLLHRAVWKFDWDSSQLPAGQGTGIEFTVTDAAGLTSSVTHTYNVVPYISRVETGLSASYSSTLARSAEGRYPVLTETAQGTYETLTVHGWNIDSTAASLIEARLSSDPDALLADGTTRTGVLLTHGNTISGDNILTVELNSGGSGYLTILVDGVPSRNNTNDNLKQYNREASDIHQVLNDDRYISVWDVTRIWRTVSLADHAVYPSMVMSGDTPHFAYANNSMGWGQGFYLAGAVNRSVIQNWDLFTYTAVALNDSGNYGALIDVNVVNGNFGNYNAGNYGGIFVNFYYGTPAHTWMNYDFLDYGLWLENLVDTGATTTAVLNRYQYPDMVMRGTTASTQVFYSVYDTLNQELIFRHFLTGTDSSIDDSSGGRLNDGAAADDLYTNVPQQTSTGAWPNYSGNDRFGNAGAAQPGATPPGGQVISTSATSFSAVGSTTDGSTAVIAYYDDSGSGKLVFRYNSTPDSAAGWSAPVTIEEFVNAEYMDLKVDSADHIHLAYYDSYHGDVKYAYIPSYSSGSGDISLYTVDSYLIIGSKLTLGVNPAGIPFLAYKGLGNSARAAWLTGSPANGVSSDRFTGSWEVQTVPDLISDSDSNRFNIGVDTAGMPVVGYTDDGLEYSRLLPELSN